MPEIQQLVAADSVAVWAGATSRRSALLTLADLLSRTQEGADRDAVAEALIAREALQSTGFGRGVAIPHARVPGLTRIHGAILHLRDGTEWEAVDGLPVDIVVALIGPDDGSTAMLKALAAVARMLRDDELVHRLRGAEDADSLWAMIAFANQKAA